MRKPLPNALDIDFEGGLAEEVTPHAGVALLLELGRRCRVMAAERQRQGSFIPREPDRLAGLQAVLDH